MSESDSPALKEMFNPARYRQIARDVSAVYPAFDGKKFLKLALLDLDSLNLLQRLRRATESLGATLPPSYPKALDILRQAAPSQSGFVSLFLPDFVGVYGKEHFDLSMDALKFFTSFGSSEFAVREFLRLDQPRALKIMETWSRDENEHVRRLASEGSRPRLPWSFRLTALVENPDPTAPILENLRDDPSPYVRKSVANHLNDITKNHPAWVLRRLQSWPLNQPHTAWIAKHALRTLIKQGDRRALSLFGAGAKARVKLGNFTLEPRQVKLGETLAFSCLITSVSSKDQKLIVDYAIHYRKKSGSSSPKVFKLKELVLKPQASATITKRQVIRDFTTRKHHAGEHVLEIVINGELFGRKSFVLVV